MRVSAVAVVLALVAATVAVSAAPAPPAVPDALGASAPGALVARSVEGLATAAGVDALPPVAPVPCGGLADAVAAFAAYHDVPVPAGGVGALAFLTADEARAVAGLVCALHAAALLRDEAYAGADWGAIARYAFTEDEATLAAAPAGVLPNGAIAANAAGAAHIARAVDDALDALAPRPVPAGAPGGLHPPLVDLQPILAIDPIGIATYYDYDYALVVDVGGNDLYDNNAGGSLIAFGDGAFFPIRGDNSTWQHVVAPNGDSGPKIVVGGDFEDGELLFSATLALDLAGDDTYGVYRAPITDAACTDEPVVTRVATQGTGMGGPGMLFDLGGDNHLRAKSIAQGSGHVGGFGVLYLGDGNDRLDAVRIAHGSGLFGGIGLLVNSGGDDEYVARSPAGGLFNTDGGFCDDQPRYTAGSGFARVQGGATGPGGALLDLGGNDRYVVDTKSGGFAEVASFGILYDADGNDRYDAVDKALGFGWGRFDTGGGAFAMLLDVTGDDSYRIATADGLGASGGRLPDPDAIPEPFFPPQLWLNYVLRETVDPLVPSGIGILADLGGADAYDSPHERGNDAATANGAGGAFVDAERPEGPPL